MNKKNSVFELATIGATAEALQISQHSIRLVDQ